MSVLSFAYVWMLTASQNIFLVVSECSGVFFINVFFFYASNDSAKHQTLKQHNKTAQPKADKYPTSHFSQFNCYLSVVFVA